MDLEEKVNEIDKGLSTLVSIKRSIEETMQPSRNNSFPEIQELKCLQRESEKYETEMKSLKTGIKRDLENWAMLEDMVHQICKRKCEYDEEIENLTEYGISMENKKVILKKSCKLKDEISDTEIEIVEMRDKVLNKFSNNFNNEYLVKSIEKLDIQNKDQHEKIEKLIEQHKHSIEVEENFDSLYLDLIKEITNKELEIKNLQISSKKIKVPNLMEVALLYSSLSDLSRVSQQFSSSEGKELIINKMDYLEKTWKSLETVHNQTKRKIEKQEFERLELTNQGKKLKEWLQEIEETIIHLKNEKYGNVAQKQNLCMEIKRTQIEIQEWKNNMDKFVDSVSKVNTEDNSIEMLKKYRKLLEEINSEVTRSELDLQNHVQFNDKVEEFIKWLSLMENSAAGLVVNSDILMEKINEQIKNCVLLQSKLLDGKSKLIFLENLSGVLIPNTSLEGQGNIKETLKKISKRYNKIEEVSKEKLKELEVLKFKIQEFEKLLQEFESWLSKKEQTTTNKCLLSTLKEKETELEKFQNHLLSIHEHKDKLDELIEKGKYFPLNFSINHNIKAAQIRNGALISSAKHRIESLVKWVDTHRLSVTNEKKFMDLLQSFERSFNSLKEGKKHLEKSDEMIEKFDSIDKNLIMIENLKLIFNASLRAVLGETNERGGEEISKKSREMINIYMNNVNLYNQFKSSFQSDRIEENQLKSSLRILSRWLDTSLETIKSHNLSSQIECSNLEFNLNEMERFSEEIQPRLNSFKALINNFKPNKSEDLIVLINSVEEKFNLELKTLSQKKGFIEVLLKINEKFRTSRNVLNNWFININKVIQSASDVRGSESAICLRYESLKEVTISMIMEGKLNMKNFIDSADILIKNVTDLNEKDKITHLVQEAETEYFNLKKKAEDSELAIQDVFNQWKTYDKNIVRLDKIIKDYATRKQKFKSLKLNWASNMEKEMEKLKGFINDILEQKSNLELLSSQVKSLKDISMESHVEIIFQDLLDQLDTHEIDCKAEMERITQIINERKIFDRQYQTTTDRITLMKSNLEKFDQLYNVASLDEYRRIISDFKLLECRIADTDRLVDECLQISLELAILFDSEKSLNDIMGSLVKEWKAYKKKFGEVKIEMNRLFNLWSTTEDLNKEIEMWIQNTNKEMDGFKDEGYQNDRSAEKLLSKMKNLLKESKTFESKLSKYVDFIQKADVYSGFSKHKDPLLLQRRFHETCDSLKELESKLITIHSGKELLLHDFLEAEKWIIDLSRFINDEFQKVQSLNILSEIQHEIKLYEDLKSKIEIYNEGKIKPLIKKSDDLDKMILKQCPLKSEFSNKSSNISEGMKNLILSRQKLKKAIKQKSNAIQRHQKIIDKVENFLYQEFPKWWKGKEITITRNPDNCQLQIEETSKLLENTKVLEVELEKLWKDQTNQSRRSNSLTYMSSDFDTLSKDSLAQSSNDSTNDSMYRLKTDWMSSKDKIEKRIDSLLLHKQKWNGIENDIDDLLKLITLQGNRLKQIVSNVTEDETLYDYFEAILMEVISKRDNIQKINDQIMELCSNNETAVQSYSKYTNLNQNYSDLLQEIESIRKSLSLMNVHNLYENIMSEEEDKDGSPNIKKLELLSMNQQIGTQTNRNKATSMRTIKRYFSIPNLQETHKSTFSQTTKQLKKILKQQEKMIQTVNDVGTQSMKLQLTLSQYADQVMRGRNVFRKQSLMLNPDESRKETRFIRLNALLAIIRDIREEISPSTLNLRGPYFNAKNVLRNSTESVRHNITTSIKPKFSRNSKTRQSFDCSNVKLLPNGSNSPRDFSKELPRKRSNSLKRSSSKICSSQNVFAF